MKDINIKNELLNRELLPFSHIYWKKKIAFKNEFNNIKKSKRHNTTQEIALVFYKNIIRLQ